METNKISGGYVKLHRSLFDWEWWDDINTFRLFVTILLLANWKDKNWHGRTIKRGSLWTSLDTLSKKSGLTMRQTRIALDKLITTGELTSETTNRGRLVTVVNYEVYQSDAQNVTNQTASQTAEKRQTRDKQSGKQTATTEEYKEYKNIKNNSCSSRAGDGEPRSILSLLTESEGAEIFDRYEDADWLIDMIDEELSRKHKFGEIDNPLRYVIGFADKKGWPLQEG